MGWIQWAMEKQRRGERWEQKGGQAGKKFETRTGGSWKFNEKKGKGHGDLWFRGGVLDFGLGYQWKSFLSYLIQKSGIGKHRNIPLQ